MLNVQNYVAGADNTEFDWDAYTNDEQAEEVLQDQYSDVYVDEDGTVWF